MSEKKKKGDDIARRVTQFCCRFSESMAMQFVLRDRKVAYEEIFSSRGLLPAMCKRADQLCSLCFGYGIGVEFENEKRSMLGTAVIFNDSTPLIIRLACIVDVISELYYSAPSRKETCLDELLSD